VIWTLLAAVAVFVLPFVLGKLIARLLRMKDISVRIGVVLLAAFLGLTPFVSQWVLGMQEQREYQAALAEWRQKQEERLSNSKITHEGLAKLKQALPELQVVSQAGDDEGAFTAPPGAGAAGNGAPAANGASRDTPASNTPAGGAAPAGNAATPDNAPADGSPAP
jgi:hypothetical protein